MEIKISRYTITIKLSTISKQRYFDAFSDAMDHSKEGDRIYYTPHRKWYIHTPIKS